MENHFLKRERERKKERRKEKRLEMYEGSSVAHLEHESHEYYIVQQRFIGGCTGDVQQYSMFQTNVKDWHRQFYQGQQSVTYMPQPGTAHVATTAINIAAVPQDFVSTRDTDSSWTIK